MVMDTTTYQVMAEAMEKVQVIGIIMFVCLLISTLSLAVIAIALCARRFH